MRRSYIGTLVAIAAVSGASAWADFSGKVVDEQGRPVPGALVKVEAAPSKTADWSLSDKDGLWRAPESATPAAALPVYAYAPDLQLPAAVQPEQIPVADLLAGRAILRLTHAQPVKLTVTDGSRNPLPNAAVAVVGHTETPATPSAQPQPVPIAPTGTTIGLAQGNVHLLVQAKGFAPRVVQFPVNGPMGATVVLGPGEPLVARIEDQHGKAIAGATLRPVGWVGLPESLDLGVSLTSAANGLVEWDDAPAAVVRAHVTAPGFLARDAVEIKPKADNHITLVPQAPILLHLQQAGGPTGEIKGLSITRGVVDGKQTLWDPQPLPAEALHRDKAGDLSYTETQAHDALLFRVAGADIQPAQTAPIPLDGKQHALTLTLTHGDRIGGTLTDAAGRPAPNVSVRLLELGDPRAAANSPPAEFTQLLSPDALQQHPADVATTDAAGRFAFSPRSADLLLLAQGDAGYLCAPIKPDAALGSFKLTPWAEIDGTLRQGSRLAAAGTWVTAHGSAGAGLPAFQGAGRTDSKGYFRIPHMIAGAAVVTGPGAPAESVQLQPGKRISITLGGGGRTVVAKLTNPPAAAADSPAIIEPVLPLPQVTLPPDFHMSTNSQRQAFYDTWRQSPAGAAFLAAQTAAAAHHDHPVLSDDGSLRIESIKPGDYRLRFGDVQYPFTVPPAPPNAPDQILDLGALSPQPAYAKLTGQPAPDFLLVRFDGKAETLSSLWQPRPAGSGDVVLLEFWASTSAPSRAQEVPLKKIFDTLGPAGGRRSRLEIVSLSTDDQEAAARTYVQAHAMPWTNAWIGPLGAPGAFAAQVYEVRELPTFVLIDTQGKIAAITHHADAIAPAVHRALSGQ
ncbi:MAG TPA: thioredoxin-like domain-containing protein [Phycisphaerae bacterium]|nr:thioredoxin-like domain-containing protein [Phycisphaerae bacterium]